MKEYKNKDLIVYWYPELCSHPGICVRALPEVFDRHRQPWVDIDGADPVEIIKAIDLCPSGALRYDLPEGSAVESKCAEGSGRLQKKSSEPKKVTIKVSSQGPLVVSGPTELLDSGGNKIFEAEKMVLCGCGGSCNKPYCDGSHAKNKQ